MPIKIVLKIKQSLLGKTALEGRKIKFGSRPTVTTSLLWR